MRSYFRGYIMRSHFRCGSQRFAASTIATLTPGTPPDDIMASLNSRAVVMYALLPSLKYYNIFISYGLLQRETRPFRIHTVCSLSASLFLLSLRHLSRTHLKLHCMLPELNIVIYYSSTNFP